MKTRAFSLVEMILILVIIALMAAIAAPRYSQFIANQQIEGAARRVSADLALAQHDAKQSSSSRTVTFDLITSSYQLYGVKDPNRVGRDYQVKLSEEPYRARIVSASFGGNAQLVFDGFGSPDTGGSVVIGVGNLRKTIDIDPVTGRSGRKALSLEQMAQ